MQERQQRRRSNAEVEGADHGADGRDAATNEFAAAKDDSGDRQKRVASADIRNPGGGRKSNQGESREHAEHPGERIGDDLDLQKRPTGAFDRLWIASAPRRIAPKDVRMSPK